MKQVTIVVPVYNEADNLEPFLEETALVFERIRNAQAIEQSWEELPIISERYKKTGKTKSSRKTKNQSSFCFSYLFVNDGSSDKTLEKLRWLSSKRKDVSYLSLSRNFGKEAAIYAGLKYAKGDYVILMDGDLQHPPELIPDMLKAVCSEGYQAAGAKRKSGFASRMFTGFNNKVSSVKLEKGATDYMCMSRKYVDAVLQLSESQRFSKGLFAWVGFDVKWLDYEQGPRRNGKSKWSSAGLFSYAADGITSFSILPLKIVTIAGVIICILAVIYILITLIQTLIFGIDVPGYVTTLIMILFMGGVIMLAIGILGAYIGRIYLESKDRPLYILQEEKMQNNTRNQGENNLRPEKQKSGLKKDEKQTSKLNITEEQKTDKNSKEKKTKKENITGQESKTQK